MKKILTLLALLVFSTILLASPKNYQIKSGEIKYEINTEMFGTSNIINSTLYFDDFGKKEASRTISDGNFLGMDEIMDITSISTESNTYIINHATKEYSVIAVENSEEIVESSNIGEDFDIEDYEKIGEEQVLNKKCDILFYEGNDEEGKISNKLWMWKGLVLKMELSMEMEGMSVSTKMIAKEIKTGKIDGTIFEVPSNYTEMNDIY